MKELEALGFRKVPVTVLGEKAILGFNREELSQLFGLAQASERPVADGRLFETFDKILESVIRAARQVPSDRLMWHTPDRNRPLKVFCYHILADPNHVLEAISSGKYDGSFKLIYVESSGRFRTMEEIARFGEETRARLKEASKSFTSDSLNRPIEGYAGPTNGHELLHLVLRHTAHHLRQLYEMLRMIGVTPVNPLEEKDFSGIRMPKELW